MSIVYTNNLDMHSRGVPLIVHLGQYDSDFSLVFNLYSSVGALTIESGTTAEIRGTKSDGFGYSADATIDIVNKKVTVAGSNQMTAAARQNIFELVLLKNNKVLSSANFILDIEHAALDADTIQDESVLKELNAIIAGAETATQAASAAAESAEAAAESARTLTIDNTLTHQGQAADAKKVGDEITALKDDLYEGSGETRTELSFVTGKYINTGGAGVNIGDTINVNSPGTFSTLRYTIADCVEGDKFYLDDIHGAASGRAWAFLTSANVLISRADASVAITGYITAPANSGKVVINDNTVIYDGDTPIHTDGHAYKVTGSSQVLTLDKMVRFDKAQDLTAEEKAQARDNIGVSGQGSTDFSLIDKEPFTTATGWRLQESNGCSTSNESYKLVKYNVTSGDYIKVISDDRFQFQNNISVPSSLPNNRIGETYGTGTFELQVPEGASVLIVSTPLESEAHVYDGIKIDELDYTVQTVTEVYKKGDDVTGENLFDLVANAIPTGLTYTKTSADSANIIAQRGSGLPPWLFFHDGENYLQSILTSGKRYKLHFNLSVSGTSIQPIVVAIANNRQAVLWMGNRTGSGEYSCIFTQQNNYSNILFAFGNDVSISAIDSTYVLTDFWIKEVLDVPEPDEVTAIDKTARDAINQKTFEFIDYTDIPTIAITVDNGGSLPTTKADGEVNSYMQYKGNGMTFSDYCTLKVQGDSSVQYPKKNFTVKLFTDSARTKKDKRVFRNWGKANKYVLKANWIDHSHARNIVNARLWSQIMKSRPDFDALPTVLKASHLAVDGFPVKVFANGVYQGLYTWNVPKSGLYGLDDEIDTNAIVQGNSSVYSGSLIWRASSDPDNKWTDETHDIKPTAIKNGWDRVLAFVYTSTDTNFINNFGDYFDKQSVVDQYIWLYVACIVDNLAKNQTFFTYDAVKWYGGMYDMDGTWGCTPSPPDRAEWYDYNTAFQTGYTVYPGSGGYTNLLYERVGNLFATDIESRYESLRNSVLTASNIDAEFDRFMGIIPPYLYEEDYAETTGNGQFINIPSKNLNHTQQIRQFVKNRLAYVDSMILGNS